MALGAAAQSTGKVLDVHGKDGSVVSVPLSEISYVSVSDAAEIAEKEVDFNTGVASSELSPAITSEITTTNCREALDNVMNELESDWGVTGTMYTVMKALASSELYSSTTCFRAFTFNYESVAADGSPITLSALLAYPYDESLGESAEENTPNNVVLYNHFTLTANNECPTSINERFSFQNTLAAMWANSRRRSLVVIPDYEGYGVSADRPHPFVQQPALARQGVDALRAGLQLYKELGLPALADGWQTVTYGGSQGGGQALAVHRMIEENGLVDELNFAGSISSGGPYDPLKVLEHLMATPTVSYPALYPLTLIGLCFDSPYLEGVDPRVFFTDEMNDLGLIDIINTKEYRTTEIGAMMRQYDAEHDGALGYNGSEFLTNKVIRQDIIDCFAGKEVADPDVLPLVENLKKAICASNNQIELGWKPQHPTIMLHSSQDTYVAYSNFLATEAAWVGDANAHFIHYDGEMLKHHNTLTALSLIGLARLEADLILKGKMTLVPFDFHVAEPTELINKVMSMLSGE